MTGSSDAWGLLVLLLSGFAAGGINSIAGGGTILTFAVLSSILPPGPGRLVAANVTSKIGLWPGAVAAAWAYRGSREAQPPWARWLVLPSGVGAVLGVVLLRVLPKESFDAVVPWLILLAAVLFAVQPHLTRLMLAVTRPAAPGVRPQQASVDRRLGGGTRRSWERFLRIFAGEDPPNARRAGADPRASLAWIAPSSLQRMGGRSRAGVQSQSDPVPPAGALQRPPAGRFAVVFALQLLVGIYGGYFGAGIGILMLGTLAVLGLGDVHAVNASKNLLAAVVNGVSGAVLVAVAIAGGFQVSWLHVAILAAGSIAGGFVISHAAQRLPAGVVRRLVAIIAFALAGYHFWREWTG